MTKNTVNISVNNRKTNALCDTGASVSCISKLFFEKAFPINKPSINPCHIQSIVGVGGTHHSVLGAIEIDTWCRRVDIGVDNFGHILVLA